jgi:hypothetical protein
LIAETKKDLNEIEKVVSEFQSRQEEMKRFVGQAEVEVERLENKELEIIGELKAKAANARRGKFSMAFWFFTVVFIAFLVALLQYAPIEYPNV